MSDREKRTRLTVDAETFLRLPIVDTSIETEIFGITAENRAAVERKLASLYGDVAADGDGVTVPAQPHFDKKRYGAADALRVIERLARDGDGCPWDRVQTHESIRINLVEEAYEAVDAIDKRDLDNMCEEFGDVFLQSILQSDIARRAGEFDFADVCDMLCKKLIGRHTFIFGTDTASNADEALVGWEKAKAAEKHYASAADQLRKLPEGFPALLLCEKVYKKLKKAGANISPEADLADGVRSGDCVKIIAAAAAILAANGKDAEVELNKYLKAAISRL